MDLIGLPVGDYWVHEFPSDLAAGQTVQLTLNDVKKKLITFSGNNVKPDKRPKQPDKFSRSVEISLQFRQKIKAIKIFLNMNSRIVFVLGKRETSIILRPEILIPDEAHIITYYKRNKNKKVLNACFFGSGHPVTDMHHAMVGCDVVMAVDTNSQDIPGSGKITATSAIEAYFKEVTEDACHMQTGAMRQKISIDPPGNPEIYGIGTMMFHLFETKPELINKRVGIITDTDLGLLKEINQRKIPFFESMFLPENTIIFYATSDSGSTEFMANKLIRMCDKASTEYLNKHLNR
jgi:hypothetical protein